MVAEHFAMIRGTVGDICIDLHQEMAPELLKVLTEIFGYPEQFHPPLSRLYLRT